MAPAVACWVSSSKNTVCVMDASGPLGTALVARLLCRGYTVHAAVQNRVDWYKGKKWINGDRLRVFQSDPLDYWSIMEALKGCCALFYSFASSSSENPSYNETMGELEVRAANNVLEACAQTDTINKVVFTSSAAAIIWRDNLRHTNDENLDERNWSDINFCKNFKLWHVMWKTIAEKTAWALAKDRGVNMVSINGGLLVGPDLSIKDPYLLGAEEMYRAGVLVTVDLQYLVDSHICVFEDSCSYGRYLCFNGAINSAKDIVKLASMVLPGELVDEEDDCGRVYRQRISNQKLTKLMLHFNGDSGVDGGKQGYSEWRNP